MRIFLSILAVFLLILYAKNHLEGFSNVAFLKPEQFAVLSCLIFISFIANGFRLKIASRVAGIKLSTKEWFGLSLINSMWSQFIPKGGGASCLIYLKQKSKKDTSVFSLGAILGSSYLISIFSASVIGLMASFLMRDYLTPNFFLMLVTVFLTTLSLLLLFFLISKRSFRIGSGRVKVLIRLFKVWSERKNSKYFIILFFVDSLVILLFAFRLYFCFNVIEISASYAYVLLLSAVIHISFVFSVTPSDIGVRETIAGLLFKVYGIEAQFGVLGTLIDRFTALIWILIFGLIFQNLLMAQTKKTG